MFSWLRRVVARKPASISSQFDNLSSGDLVGMPLEITRFLERGSQDSNAGNHASALSWYERALQVDPQSSKAHSGAGWAALRLGNLECASDHFIFARHYDRHCIIAAMGMARALELQGELVRSAKTVETALLDNPGNHRMLYTLARLRYASGQYEEGLDLLRQLLSVMPDHAEGLNLLGLILAREFGNLRAGESHVRHAISQSPELLAARSNLGWILAEQGRLAEALACFDEVIESAPEDAETRLMRAYTLLKRGEFAAAWPDFEARHGSLLAIRRDIPFAECPLGEDLIDKKVLVYAEQGLGDQIMFASCIPDLVADGAECLLECDARLAALFNRSFPSVRIIPFAPESSHPAWLDESQTINWKMASGSLPRRFRNRWEDFPKHEGYLLPDSTKVVNWRRKLSELGPGPYIGISWLGGARQTRRQLRSIPLAQWQPLLSNRAVFVSLQYGDCGDEIADFFAQNGIRIQHWADSLADYDETAAMVYALDMVISVCTAVVHLAGALGKPVWVLTPTTAEWRYLDRGERLPWYPSAKLFRQMEGESWQVVLQRAESELKSVFRIQ